MPTPIRIPEVPLFGQLIIPGQEASALPLQKTSVQVQITGPLSSVSVSQFYANPYPQPLELEYLFPLPHKAALAGFEILIGKRTLKGDLQELKKAQEAYQDAREQGKQAGLLEQRRPNLFAVRIANVLPGENVRAVLRYQERLGFDNGQYEFVFPMGITPKYHTADHANEREGVDAPIAGADETIGPVEMFISIDAGVAVDSPSSPSHSLSITRLDDRRLSLQLASPAIPDHDFILRYSVTDAKAVAGGWYTPAKDPGCFLATLIPPSLTEEPQNPPAREFVFVFDRSGSMSGEPIAQARNALQACLRILNPEDTFYVIFFDDQIEWFSNESSPVTQERVDAADRYLAGITGRGGTEILRALDCALSLPPDAQDRSRYIVFLTDGAVSGEERMLEELRRRLKGERIFTFGIGPSVNRALLQQLARFGRGTAEFLQLDEDIEGAIMRFQDRVSYPVLTDISVQLEHCKTWDVYPAALPDLYAGQPVELTGRIKTSGKKNPVLVVQAKQQGNPVTMRLELTAVPADPAIERAWARARVDDLLDQSIHQHPKLRDAIISLALEYQLVTPFTAFVALDDQAVLEPGEKAKKIQIAQPLPEGLDINGFLGGPALQMRAMAAPPPTGIPRPLMAASPSAMVNAQRRQVADRYKAKLQYTQAESAPQNAPLSLVHNPQEVLRLLARTQNLNGSWNNDLEATAAALLAFVRQGQTPQNGLYRRQLRKTLQWLLSHPADSGFAGFVRVIALRELADKQNAPDLLQTSLTLQGQLPAPATELEKLAAQILSNQPVTHSLTTINSFEDLRLAGLLHIQLKFPEPIPDNWPFHLVQIWLACM